MAKTEALFPASMLPRTPAHGAVAWCSYPASPSAKDCLRWRTGKVNSPADCADCMFCQIPAPAKGEHHDRR